MRVARSGTRIARYRLERLLGRGGMGEVWLAELEGPQGFRRLVALKLLIAGPSEEALSSDLAREARLGGMLSHPNIAGTYELGQSDGRWYVAMEHVDGPNLDDLCRSSGKLPGRAIVEVGCQVAAALHALHSLKTQGALAGLVHRDVKPTNILIDRHGVVKLVDLGIARVAMGGASTPAGTPAFMPLEQYNGAEDHRADLFALGCVLYFLATGRRPFGKGENAMLTVARADEMLAHADFLAPVESHVPGLGRVLERCLCVDPERRWPTAEELGRVLAALVDAQATCPPLAILVEQARDGSTSSASGSPTLVYVEHSGVGDTTIPQFYDAFVGRQDELAAVREHLEAGTRLLVLTGLGGMGKTRLTLNALSAPRYAGKVHFVDLAAVKDAQGICAAVSVSLQIPLLRTDSVAQIGQALCTRGQIIVVLDNFEQLVDLAPETVSAWLAAAPEVSFVVTSRVRLSIRGEQLMELGALTPEAAADLFWQRAPRGLSESERADLTELLDRLDHMPLAIELAAARTRVLKVPQILSRLKARFKLLRGQRRGIPERHQSLRAVLEGSWELLTPWEQSALAQLSVFSGGWTLEAAEAVVDLTQWDDAPWAFDAIASLMDNSLVRLDRDGERFAMLVSVREFAADKLADVAAAHHRHGAWYRQMGTVDALEALYGHGGVERFRAQRAALPNLLVACRRALDSGDAEIAVGAGLAAHRVLLQDGPTAVGLAILEAIVALERPYRRGEVLCALATVMATTSRVSEAPSLAIEALELAQTEDDPGMEASALAVLAHVDFRAGRRELARERRRRALELYRQTGNRHRALRVLYARCGADLQAGRLERVRKTIADALPEARALGNVRLVAKFLGTSTILHARRMAMSEARETAVESLAIWQETGDVVGESEARRHLGALDADAGNLEESRAHFTAALQIERDTGSLLYEALMLSILAALAIRRVEPDEATALANAALEIFADVPNRAYENKATLALGAAAHLRGELDVAAELVAKARAGAEAIGGTLHVVTVCREQALLRLASGDVVGARESVETAEANMPAVPDQLASGKLACVRARVAYAEGHTTTAAIELAGVEELMAEVQMGPRSELGTLLADARRAIGLRDA